MKDFWIFIISIFAIIISFTAVVNRLNDISKQEGAMEVYRGNTTLEYKVVDGVKVDSCVIFKNK